MDPAQGVIEQPGFQQSLRGIIDTRKHGIPDKGKYYRIRMQWPYPTKGGVWQIKIQLWPIKL